MKKIIPLVILLILLVIGISGWYLMKGSSSNPLTKKEMEGSGTQNTVDSESKNMSLKSLIGLGKNMKCTYSYSDEGSESSGVTYVSGKKVRSDYKNTSEGKSTSGSMISDGAFIYTWGDNMKEGFKMAITDEISADIEEGKKELENNPSKYNDMDREVDYKCTPWIVAQNTFMPPSDIKFVDYSAQMQELQKLQVQPSAAVQTGEDDKTTQCAVCANFTGEEAAQCKSSLGCP